ncbi:hypothetical protein FBEOM_4608 [Fusarium beomiforme]|uniref:Uncharacterized protein n=1 Tax=Fusarium beomiforme TaxID=44412 RepID=A0A9P5AMM1_9HYPO|nr:hypothetical protein FBEOM_4608 [Fusarium beomiforme]
MSVPLTMPPPVSREILRMIRDFAYYRKLQWSGDADYLLHVLNTTLHKDLRRVHQELTKATQADIDGANSGAAEESTASIAAESSAEFQRDLAIENLRVQIDISNSLHALVGIFHTTHFCRQLASGKSVVRNGYPMVPPRVGPNTLHQRFCNTEPAGSDGAEESSNSAGTLNAGGKKRAAPGSGGEGAGGRKKFKTK